MDLGNFERVPNGYRVHTAMIAFAWKEQDVATAVEALPKHKDRKAGRASLGLLVGKSKQLVQGHRGQAYGFLGEAWGLCGAQAAKAAFEIHRNRRFGMQPLATFVLASQPVRNSGKGFARSPLQARGVQAANGRQQ